MAAKIPVTVITGFLGSGKTTLVPNLLKQAEGRRIAVIVKEFGELGVESKPMRLVVQGVGQRTDQFYDRPWRPDEPRHTQLVFIGYD